MKNKLIRILSLITCIIFVASAPANAVWPLSGQATEEDAFAAATNFLEPQQTETSPAAAEEDGYDSDSDSEIDEDEFEECNVDEENDDEFFGDPCDKFDEEIPPTTTLPLATEEKPEPAVKKAEQVTQPPSQEISEPEKIEDVAPTVEQEELDAQATGLKLANTWCESQEAFETNFETNPEAIKEAIAKLKVECVALEAEIAKPQENENQTEEAPQGAVKVLVNWWNKKHEDILDSIDDKQQSSKELLEEFLKIKTAKIEECSETLKKQEEKNKQFIAGMVTDTINNIATKKDPLPKPTQPIDEETPATTKIEKQQEPIAAAEETVEPDTAVEPVASTSSNSSDNVVEPTVEKEEISEPAKESVFSNVVGAMTNVGKKALTAYTALGQAALGNGMILDVAPVEEPATQPSTPITEETSQVGNEVDDECIVETVTEPVKENLSDDKEPSLEGEGIESNEEEEEEDHTTKNPKAVAIEEKEEQPKDLKLLPQVSESTQETEQKPTEESLLKKIWNTTKHLPQTAQQGFVSFVYGAEADQEKDTVEEASQVGNEAKVEKQKEVEPEVIDAQIQIEPSTQEQPVEEASENNTTEPTAKKEETSEPGKESVLSNVVGAVTGGLKTVYTALGQAALGTGMTLNVDQVEEEPATQTPTVVVEEVIQVDDETKNESTVEEPVTEPVEENLSDDEAPLLEEEIIEAQDKKQEEIEEQPEAETVETSEKAIIPQPNENKKLEEFATAAPTKEKTKSHWKKIAAAPLIFTGLVATSLTTELVIGYLLRKNAGTQLSLGEFLKDHSKKIGSGITQKSNANLKILKSHPATIALIIGAIVGTACWAGHAMLKTNGIAK
ncbi:hypothetical protein HOD08_05135 [bacterium]|nr:hypothetical protein [bacterium]